MVSIELLFDADLEAAVRAEWTALADAGFSSLGRHASPSNRPHVTLAVRTAFGELDAASPLLRPAFPVTLGAPLLFGSGDRRVLARAVVPSAELIELHAAVHRAAGAGDDAPHTAPGGWTPHVTLARRIRVADLPAALALIEGDLTGRVRALRRWDAASALVTDLGSFGPAR